MPSSDTAPFPYKYAYSRTCFPRSGHGTINGYAVSLLAQGLATIRTVASKETRLVARLGIPGSSDTVDLRRLDGALLRTVCRPGSKRPCSLGEFVEAAASGSKWRDSPFNGRTSASHHVTDVSGSDAETLMVRKWGDDSKEAQTQAAIQATLSQHVVVDGVVYRPSGEPTLRLFSTPNPETDASPRAKPSILQVGWYFDDFDAFSDHDRGRTEKPDHTRGGTKPTYPVAFANGMDVFGLDREGDARAYATASAPGHYWAPPTAWKAVHYVDPSALTPREDDMVRLLEAARREMHHWSALNRLPDERIVAWMGARRTLSRPSHELGEDEVRAAFDALSFAAKSEGDSRTGYVTGNADLLRRWDVVERARDFVLRAADDTLDEDAVVGMAM